jgi:hypothetical protein
MHAQTMLKSHVSGGFWLGGFKGIKAALPEGGAYDLLLESQRQEHWPVRWLPDKDGMSGGWKRFAKDHDLQEQDIVLFYARRIEEFKHSGVLYSGLIKCHIFRCEKDIWVSSTKAMART